VCNSRQKHNGQLTIDNGQFSYMLNASIAIDQDTAATFVSVWYAAPSSSVGKLFARRALNQAETRLVQAASRD